MKQHNEELPALVGKPWEYVGISRSAFYRLLNAGNAPAPVRLRGAGRRWRRVDIDVWISSLEPDTIRHRGVSSADA